MNKYFCMYCGTALRHTKKNTWEDIWQCPNCKAKLTINKVDMWNFNWTK